MYFSLHITIIIIIIVIAFCFILFSRWRSCYCVAVVLLRELRAQLSMRARLCCGSPTITRMPNVRQIPPRPAFSLFNYYPEPANSDPPKRQSDTVEEEREQRTEKGKAAKTVGQINTTEKYIAEVC